MQRMVVLRKPKKRMAGVACEEFRDSAESVQIGSDAGANDSRFFAPVQWCDAGKEPSGKEVGDRAHGQRTAGGRHYCIKPGKSAPLISLIK